jgi:hypothetical protein
MSVVNAFLSEILGASVSSDSINRFLLRERYTPMICLSVSSREFNFTADLLSGDDMVPNKFPVTPRKTALVDYFFGQGSQKWSRINLITFVLPDPNGTGSL